MKALLVALLILGGLRIGIPYIRRFADPDPRIYGHPRGPA